ncbi:MAG: exonuclease SbcCD subunit D, partial [Halococcoides sp.]
MPTLTHLADTHLGHRQYGLKQREDDMLSTTRATIDAMLAHDPEAIVLPGDLFHSRDLRPKVLHRIERELERVPDEVPVIVSRGNHDENLTPREVTWLNYLHQRGRIVFLRADLDGETAGFVPYDPGAPGDHAGFIDLSVGFDRPVRVFGLQWRGAKTGRALEQVGRGIRATNDDRGDPALVVLLSHFGIEDEVPSLGGSVTHADLDPIRDVVDYLALGHVHKRYEAGEWIYNPGSPEAHSTREGHDDWTHGYYEVELGDGVDTGDGGTTADPPVAVTHHRTQRRPYVRIEFDVTPHDTAGDLTTAFHEHVRDQSRSIEQYCETPRFTAGSDPRAPIVDLRFTGTLQFERGAFRPDELAAWVEDTVDALHVQVNSAIRTASVQDLVAEIDDEAIFSDGRLNTDVLEDRVFETIARESPYDEATDDVADLLGTTHRMAQAGEAVEDIRETVSSARRELFPDREETVVLDIDEDPFEEADDSTVDHDGASDGDASSGADDDSTTEEGTSSDEKSTTEEG